MLHHHRFREFQGLFGTVLGIVGVAYVRTLLALTMLFKYLSKFKPQLTSDLMDIIAKQTT